MDDVGEHIFTRQFSGPYSFSQSKLVRGTKSALDAAFDRRSKGDANFADKIPSKAALLAIQYSNHGTGLPKQIGGLLGRLGYLHRT